KSSDYLFCGGGDGSLHWAGNTLIEARGHSDGLPIFVPAGGGTIDFVAAKAGIYGSPLRVLRDLVNHLRLGVRPRVRELDTLFIQGAVVGNSGVREDFSRVGFALAAGGVGARFFAEYYEERVRGRRAIARILSRAVGSHLSNHAK